MIMGNTVGRLQSVFSPHQIDVIIGSLLGDARLECRSRGERYPISARLRIQPGDKQCEYAFWKYEQLKPFVLKGPRKIKVWHDPKRNKNHYSWYFHTKTLEILGPLYHYFYRDGKKVLPEGILKQLTPFALAVWFMDDGSNTGQSYTLNTHCFSVKAQREIIKFLREQHKIAATLVKDRERFKIAIGRREYEKFTRIVSPYIIPTMVYKIAVPVTT